MGLPVAQLAASLTALAVVVQVAGSSWYFIKVHIPAKAQFRPMVAEVVGDLLRPVVLAVLVGFA